ncbi:MAG: nitroreductase [Comamonadaceae bacterium CG1_02_60_18]|nr:MAG: nitroreductase [Comamonadaceae bacterium CG1_02_60_18]PIQ51190.1 MAG: nitroreductase [Comamonadaceae bacterium CG12_big_fil_rev_8_21_14_0_65_59_15]
MLFQIEPPQPSAASLAFTLITSRQSILPRRLADPGPTSEQIEEMFQAAAAAPDHGEIRPWRFVLVPPDRRADLGSAFAQALAERDPSATPTQLAQARDKALRAPFVALVIARLGKSEPDIDELERMVSLGAAVQNVLLMAHSFGLGAGLTSGLAMRSIAVRQLFDLQDGEHAICCLNVGTALHRKPARLRPAVDSFVSSL